MSDDDPRPTLRCTPAQLSGLFDLCVDERASQARHPARAGHKCGGRWCIEATRWFFRGDYQAAKLCWLNGALTRHPVAWRNLGTLAEVGQDSTDAARWWSLGSSTGDPAASTSLAMLLLDDRREEAVDLLQQAAAMCHVRALCLLGDIHLAEEEWESAISCFQQAWRHGHRTVASRVAEAARLAGSRRRETRWLLRAWALGDLGAQERLISMLVPPTLPPDRSREGG